MDRYINLRVIASLDRLRCKRIIWLGEALINTPVWDILYCLYKSNDSVSISCIAEELLVSEELLPRWMAILEQRGFVDCSLMRRSYLLTHKGIEAVEDVLSVAYGSDEQVLAC